MIPANLEKQIFHTLINRGVLKSPTIALGRRTEASSAQLKKRVLKRKEK
jgi:hypothetical protein